MTLETDIVSTAAAAAIVDSRRKREVNEPICVTPRRQNSLVVTYCKRHRFCIELAKGI